MNAAWSELFSSYLCKFNLESFSYILVKAVALAMIVWYGCIHQHCFIKECLCYWESTFSVSSFFWLPIKSSSLCILFKQNLTDTINWGMREHRDVYPSYNKSPIFHDVIWCLFCQIFSNAFYAPSNLFVDEGIFVVGQYIDFYKLYWTLFVRNRKYSPMVHGFYY